ncbi:unnamed protein product [Symbiodinium microadriaticum]|nr:unnamed protein product [Symbiodinium microadriaticum]
MLRDPPSALPPGRYLRSTWILREWLWRQVEDRAGIPDHLVKLNCYVERAVFQYHPVRVQLRLAASVVDVVRRLPMVVPLCAPCRLNGMQWLPRLHALFMGGDATRMPEGVEVPASLLEQFPEKVKDSSVLQVPGPRASVASEIAAGINMMIPSTEPSHSRSKLSRVFDEILYDPLDGGTIRQINREEARRMIRTTTLQYRMSAIRKWHFGTSWTTYYEYQSFARSDLARQLWEAEKARRGALRDRSPTGRGRGSSPRLVTYLARLQTVGIPDCTTVVIFKLADTFPLQRRNSLFFAPPHRETPTEVLRDDDIRHAMEAATAAASANDARTVAEAEMEVDTENLVYEDEPEGEHEDPDENASIDEVAERRPILVNEDLLLIDSDLVQAQVALQVPYFSSTLNSFSVDSNITAATFMAYVVIYSMHKIWSTTVRWCDMKYSQMQKRFDQYKRYDAVGTWGPNLSRVDPPTKISRDVEDEEVIAFEVPFEPTADKADSRCSPNGIPS